MYNAKEQGKSNYQFYRPSMNQTVARKLVFEDELRRAIENRELVIFYQPVFDLCSMRILSGEAVVVWNRNDGEIVPLAGFLTIAEESGLILPLGEWLIKTACGHQKAWQAEGFEATSITINLSKRQFRHYKLDEMIGNSIQSCGMDPALLVLQITESILQQMPTEAASLLSKISAMGVRFCMANFGTGYSALSAVSSCRLDALKLDRSLANVLAGDGKAEIVRAVIAMAHSLKLKAIADGVVNRDQLEFFRKHGCDAVQGGFLGRPMSHEEFTKLLMQRRENGMSSPGD